MAKFCDQGETDCGNRYIKGADMYIGLYSDGAEPAETATLATITELAVANNYARILVDKDDWTESPQSVFTNTQKTFTASGGAWTSPSGYFLCDVASGTVGNLLAVEQFSDGPYTVNNGWSVKVTPKITVS